MKLMKLMVLSDLHADVRSMRFKFTEKDKDKIVIIPGDVSPISHFIFEETIRAACIHVKQVIFVPGNHEYYLCDIATIKKRLYEYETVFDNFVVLDNKSIIIDDVKYIGSTMWTDMNNRDWFTMNACNRGMNDFRLIHNNGKVLTPDETVDFFIESVKFISEELITSNSRENVVITHHAPSYASVGSQYINSPINPGFTSDLSSFILNNKIKYWIHGHMHSNVDYMIGDTRVVCNPRGYSDMENVKFDPRMELIV